MRLGGFHEHLDLLRAAAATAVPSDIAFEAIEVRTPAQLESCDALILPGGESTTMTLLANKGGLMDPLRDFVGQKKAPVWGESGPSGSAHHSDRRPRNLRGHDHACG